MDGGRDEGVKLRSFCGQENCFRHSRGVRKRLTSERLTALEGVSEISQRSNMRYSMQSVHGIQGLGMDT